MGGRRVQVLCLLLVVVLVVCSRPLQSRITHLRQQEGFEVAGQEPSEVIPILIMGGFRGVAVDVLWIRAMARQEERKFYELLAIFNLIAKLQPNFPMVWIFQGWNMAYNIYHEWEGRDDKWKWLREGLEFAQKGFTKNPTSGDLAFEIGYVYHHKFDKGIFPDAPYHRQVMKKELGLDNFDESARWMGKALRPGMELRFRSHIVIERQICHVLMKASVAHEEEGDLARALACAKDAAQGWQSYRLKYPDDPFGRAQEGMEYVQKRIEYLQKTIREQERGK